MPRAFAVLDIFPLFSRSAFARISFSSSSLASLIVEASGLIPLGASNSSSAGPMDGPSASTSARFTLFCSSSTLPGQLYLRIASIAALESFLTGFLNSLENARCVIE
jgi:hypothetical protein